ncbi:MAG: DUF4418 family protein [Erysipelotrichaceae bacterium]|nr:DUF4418 family protein [Erysipelotrichaceae bacterium]
MIFNNDKMAISITDLLLVVISLAFAFGIRFLFPVCAIMGEDIMACHWAGEVLKVISLIMVVLSLIHLVVPQQTKSGIDLAMVAFGGLMITVPGTIINICMMPDMHCHMTKTAMMILGIIVILTAAADIVINMQQKAIQRHARI